MLQRVSLRPATIKDAEFVFLVKKAALGEYIAQTWGWDEAFQREFHSRDYQPEETQIIAFNGQDAGWLVASESETECRLDDIYLLPEHQGLGIGSHLIRSLLADAARKSKPMKLQVLKVNSRARLLYERLGFQVVGETATHHLMEKAS